MKFLQLIGCYMMALVVLFSCGPANDYEKIYTVPSHSWNKTISPVFYFHFTNDTSINSFHIIFRHTEKYAYYNLLADVRISDSSDKNKQVLHLNIPLAGKDNKWKGRPMEDLYDYRIGVAAPFFFNKGTYKFVVQHTMPQNPLRHVLNIGISLR